MPYTSDELHDLFNNLPQDVQEAYGSIEFIHVLDDIEEKYRLHVDQIGELSNEIYKLVLGLTHPQQFINSVKISVRVPEETAQKIAEEVNEKIFRPVRASLMRIHKMGESVQETSKDSFTEKMNILTTEVPETTKINTEKSQEIKNFVEEKLSEPFSLHKKTKNALDPYREPIA